MNRAGASLVEVVVAAALLGVGLSGVAALTGASARTLGRARAMDDARFVLESFADSVLATGGGTPGTGARQLEAGVLSWEFAAPGATGWVSFQHVALPEPMVIDFAAPAPFRAAAP